MSFLLPAPPTTTAKPAAIVPVQPAMSRNSATGAVPAKTSHAKKNGAMLMRALTTINF